MTSRTAPTAAGAPPANGRAPCQPHASGRVILACFGSSLEVLANLSRRSRIAAMLVLLFALTLNLKTFRRPISMHPEISTSGALGGIRFFKEQIVQGLWAMSWPEFHSVGGQSESCLRNLRTLLETPNETVLIWIDSPVIWQKISYYFPRQPIWILDERSSRPRADLRGDGALIRSVEPDLPIPLGNAARIIWITAVRSRSGRRSAANSNAWTRISAGRMREE